VTSLVNGLPDYRSSMETVVTSRVYWTAHNIGMHESLRLTLDVRNNLIVYHRHHEIAHTYEAESQHLTTMVEGHQRLWSANAISCKIVSDHALPAHCSS